MERGEKKKKKITGFGKLPALSANRVLPHLHKRDLNSRTSKSLLGSRFSVISLLVERLVKQVELLETSSNSVHSSAVVVAESHPHHTLLKPSSLLFFSPLHHSPPPSLPAPPHPSIAARRTRRKTRMRKMRRMRRTRRRCRGNPRRILGSPPSLQER